MSNETKTTFKTAARSPRCRVVAGSELASKRISEYLTLGMHHSTKEAQEKIAEIINESNMEVRRAKYLEQKQALQSETYRNGMEYFTSENKQLS